MAIGDGYTVWILGAGFSKSLGGPLLFDLFRQQVFEDLAKTIGEERATKVTWTQALFNFGLKTYWADAEDFLSYAEAAFGNPPHATERAFLEGLLQRREFIERPLNGPVPNRFRPCWDDPLGAILHAFATETTEFLRDNATDREQWRPYLDWAESLNPERDSVITFNYDPVIETVNLELLGRGREKFQVMLPNEPLKRDKVPALKLHGSVYWVMDRWGTAGVAWDNSAVEQGRAPLIAAPGRSKANLTSRILKPLWSEAHKRLAVAENVVILGYGFPKTDAEARAAILAALEQNQCGATVRKVHLVLGPEVNLPGHRRVLELVRPRLGIARKKFVNKIPAAYRSVTTAHLGLVIQHPLYAEDFVGDYSSRTRDEVFAES